MQRDLLPPLTMHPHSCLLGVTIAAVLATACAAPSAKPPQNRTAILLDTSGTYRGRLEEAVNKASSLVERVADRKLSRWEKGNDYVSIVTIDAMPDVIWEGEANALREFGQQELRSRLAGRRDYAGCTDVATAFHKAADKLAASGPANKYIFVFSDLIDEPPATNPSTCQPVTRPSLPPAAMPWEALRDASITAFWVPIIQKHAWNSRLEQLGSAATFRIYTDSESGYVEIPAPPVAKRIYTDADREQTQRAIFSVGSMAGKVLLVGFAAIVAVFMVALGAAALLRRRGSAPPRHRPAARRPALGRPANSYARGEGPQPRQRPAGSPQPRLR